VQVYLCLVCCIRDSMMCWHLHSVRAATPLSLWQGWLAEKIIMGLWDQAVARCWSLAYPCSLSRGVLELGLSLRSAEMS